MAKIPEDTYYPTTTSGAKDAAVLILTADNVQDLEFFYPYYRLVEEGFTVDVVTPKGTAFKGKQGMGLSQSKAIADVVDVTRYQLLYIPGGKAPSALKKDEDALELVRRFAATG